MNIFVKGKRKKTKLSGSEFGWIQIESKRCVAITNPHTHLTWSWENANNVQEYFYTDVNEND